MSRLESPIAAAAPQSALHKRSWWLFICLALFPRITLLCYTSFRRYATWKLWLAWAALPHFAVAVLATKYFKTNPVLVVIAWLWAFSGESIEKGFLSLFGPHPDFRRKRLKQ